VQLWFWERNFMLRGALWSFDLTVEETEAPGERVEQANANVVSVGCLTHSQPFPNKTQLQDQSENWVFLFSEQHLPIVGK
jgi:hypothetical protein